MRTERAEPPADPARLLPPVLDRFVPDRLEDDPDGLRLGRLAAAACLTVGGASTGLAAARFLIDPGFSRVGAVLALTAASAFALLFALRASGRARTVGVGLTTVGMLGTCSMALMEGGLLSEGLYWALLVPLLTALFAGMRGAVAMAALGTVYSTGLLLLHLDGHDFGKGRPSELSLVLHYLGFTSALASGAFIGGLFERNRVRAMRIQRATEAETSRLKDEFIAVVSHELRTPLTVIRGALGLLGSGAVGSLDDEARDLVDGSLLNVDRLGRLIDDLLDMQRMVRDAMEFTPGALDVAELARRAVELNAGYGRERRVRLGCPDDLPDAQVWADPGRVQQILANLISNAIKFSPEGDAVELSVRLGPTEVVFSVADRGPGIPEAARALIFEPFRQVDASDQRSHAGSGLGLHIARRLAHAMRGDIVVEPRSGGGSVFSLSLPTPDEGAPAPG